jgi:hypothetical protein
MACGVGINPAFSGRCKAMVRWMGCEGFGGLSDANRAKNEFNDRREVTLMPAKKKAAKKKAAKKK